MLSVFENTSAPVHMHIVHDETLTPEKQLEMRCVVEAYKQDITFYIAPDIDNDTVAGVPVGFGRVTLYRLFLHKLVDLDKIIYLDCDIICGLDIEQLYKYELGESPLAAVEDLRLGSKYLQQVISKPHRYFHAGVLLLNLQWFRAHGGELIALMIRELCHNTRLEFADQDVLNIFFSQDGQTIQYIDEKFNYLVGFQGRQMQSFDMYQDKILHMTTIEKPWQNFSNAAIFYWQYYSKTPWGGSVFEEITDTYPGKQIELIYFFLRADKNNLRWLRRYREYKTLGLWNYIKKRLVKKQAGSRT